MNSFSSGSNNNWKLLYVIGSLEVGGAESQMVMLARSLKKQDYHCEVFALQANGVLREALSDAGISVHDGKYLHRGTMPQKITSLFFALFRLWFLAIKMRPNVIHAYLPLTNFIGAIAGRAAFVPVVITSRRGLGNHQLGNPAWKWIDRMANAFSSRVTVNSQAVAEDVVNRDAIRREKLVCIYNGLDFSRFQFSSQMRLYIRSQLGAAPGEFLWVKLANLIPYKGHSDLLEAFSKVSSQFSKLLLIGEDRGLQIALQKQAENLGIEKRVIFLGRRSDVPLLLSAMDGCVVASHEEGFSNAILEAMAAGLPIVATDVGGNREALQDGRLGGLTGFLCQIH